MSHPKDRLVVNLYIRTTDRRPLKLSHFYTLDGPTDAQIDGWTDGRTDRRTDRQKDGRTDRWTDRRMNGQKDIQMDGRIDGRTEERMDRVIPIYPCL
jgi:hypothetical protein